MAKEQLSDKQQQILEFIKRRILDKGYPPAVREICEAVNLRSTSSVHSHLETLERKGYKMCIRDRIYSLSSSVLQPMG